MRRRTFLLRVGVTSAGTLAFGACDGRLYTEGPRPRSPERSDAGTVRLLDGGAPPARPDAGPPTDPRGFDADLPERDAGPPDVDAGPCPGGAPRTVTLHDTNAQALYFDGTYGPTTGVITVDMIAAGEAVELEFWHGHGGVSHRYAVSAADLAALARGERVTLTTSEVEGHSHMLFVDPVDERWRVSGAADRSVTVC
ncbi:MAG: hypothetical protein KC619_18520 [Myxococcales bacterium]|nr:hypothetical protein [Myxococcales bacterium]